MAEEEQQTEFEIPGDNDDHLVAYANNVAIAHTLLDFQINFMESRIVDGLKAKVDLFATILMSPQHAKLLLASLSANVEMYEEKFGQIVIPESAYKRMTVQFEGAITDAKPAESK